MGIYLDKKSGKWYFEAMIRGKRYHRAISEATCKKDAEIYFNAFKTDLLRGKLDLVENVGNMPFKKLVDKYIEYSKTNHRSYKGNIGVANKFKSRWGNKQLRDITPMDIEKYRSDRKKEIKVKAKEVDGIKIDEKYISPTTINRDIEILRKMFNIAITNGWLVKNPCSSIKKLRQENKLERHLLLDEEARLFSACDGDFTYIKDMEKRKKIEKMYGNHFQYVKPILICALQTGMRKEEILSLEWRCVDFEKNIITLLVTKNGKKREIPISSALKTELEILKEAKLGKYVFTNPITTTRYADLKRAFTTLCSIADVKGFRFHDLRHSAATRMVASGVDIVTVKEVLGHSEITTTMRYSHSGEAQKVNAVEALASYAERNKKVIPIKKEAAV